MTRRIGSGAGRAVAPAVSALVAVLALAGCAAASGAESSMSPDELTATALVREEPGTSGPTMCVGVIDTSFPPQCGGAPLVGWDWDAVDDEESAVGVIWGEYDLVGTWDGTDFTLTRAPAAPTRPEVADGYTPWPDPADQATVDRALADYDARGMSVTGVFEMGDGAGRAMVSVFHDDGSMQAEADARYGEDVVVIESALRPVGSPRD
ncbi:hypothetical protein [Clavibacter capsici]|uniref:hypothetical protein n=1 Tax=Clavibacter capsici TaxID=1874630 RepID=UPI00293E3C9D|nr:hypothetical protein [Clavibacter capsici]